MARNKVTLAYIRNAYARKASFKKRKKNIIKKADVWPDPEGAKQVIEKYQNASVIDESKNVNQQSFILQEIAKAKDQLKKLNDDNHEKEMTIAMLGYMRDKSLPDHLTAEELRDFEKLINKKLKEIDDKIDALS